MSIVSINTQASSANRARVERVLSMIADIAGFDPDYISVTPGVKPSDYNGTGSPYGWYVREIDGQSYIQSLLWNEGTNQWDHLGSPSVTLSAFSARMDSLKTELEAGFVTSDLTDGQVSNVTTQPAIANMIALTQSEYDAIGVPNPNTMYVIVEE